MKLVTVIGARPQFIKAAPVSRVLQSTGGIEEAMVHTGQHYDDSMSKIFFEELGLPEPAINLGIQETSHGRMTGAMLVAIERVLMDRKPDAVLVYGDTNSTLAGALAAAKLNLPALHVEAGLRSFRRCQPEEINRKIVDHVSTLLFCPTMIAMDNLRREGIAARAVHTGDVMYDAAVAAAANSHGAKVVARLGLHPGNYGVITLHRAENTDNPTRLIRLLDHLRHQAKTFPLVFPLHPRTEKNIVKLGLDLDALLVVPPLGYFEMAHLVRSSAVIFTDSGGLQKEAYFHRVPCVTLRDETEWIETVEAGWNRLWTVPTYKPRREIADYGTGRAAEAVVGAIRHHFGIGEA